MIDSRVIEQVEELGTCILEGHSLDELVYLLRLATWAERRALPALQALRGPLGHTIADVAVDHCPKIPRGVNRE